MSQPSDSPLVAVTDWCLRHRAVVLAAWLSAAALGVVGALNLTPLLSSGFSLPGTDSSRVKQLLAENYGPGSRGNFVLIVEGDRSLVRVRRAAAEAISLLPDGSLTRTERLPSGEAVAFVHSSLNARQAERRTSLLRHRLGPDVLVTGDAAIEHDLARALARALKIGELYLAVPVALLILVFVFGTGSAFLPFAFATVTIPPALGLAWVAAHVLELSEYLLNMIMMIGLGIAIDYSLLVVYRYRDERRRGHEHAEAVRETMVHAGRTIMFSGLIVSLGLALMLLIPVPFLRGMGVGGLLIPVLSIVSALTFLPVLLLLAGDRLESLSIFPRGFAERRHALEIRVWTRHARWVMSRAGLVAPLVAAVLVLAAAPVLVLRVGPTSLSTLPQGLASVRGLSHLESAGSTYFVDPTTILVVLPAPGETGGTGAAIARLTRLLHADPQVATVSPALPSRNGRYLRIDVFTRASPASEQAQSFARRLRTQLVPAAGFPASDRVLAGGGAASAADFVSRTLGGFPWLVLGVVVLSFLLLTRAFGSLLLPLKAIVLNLLTVSAASGLMIACFQWGWGSWAGLAQVDQIEGWIPVFMFTLLFGLSMDYEVFLVTRMREEWEATHSNDAAVVHGLANTGRIVTAAGLIMAATFSGLMFGSIPTMQQLGFGLAVAIVLDITLVRGLLLPSTMALVGRWNWYLPARAARVLEWRPRRRG